MTNPRSQAHVQQQVNLNLFHSRMHSPIGYLTEVQLGHTERCIARFPILSNIPGYRITSSQSLPAAVPSLQPLPLLFLLSSSPSLPFLPSICCPVRRSQMEPLFCQAIIYKVSVPTFQRQVGMCAESSDFCQNNDSLCTMQNSSRRGHPSVKSRVPVPRNARGLPQSPPKGRVWLL